MFPSESMFDLQELNVLCEMHEDVLSTPPEQLIRALDYVKRAVLHGSPYRANDTPKIALGLKKFLTSSGEERRRVLEAETLRLSNEAEKERAESKGQRLAREQAEQAARNTDAHNDELRRQNDCLKKEKAELREILNGIRRGMDLQQSRDRLRMAIGGTILGALIWLSAGSIEEMASVWKASLATHRTLLHAILGSLGALIFSFPALLYVRGASWSAQLKVCATTVVIAVGIAFGHAFGDAAVAAWSNYVAIATLIAPVLALSRPQRRTAQATNESRDLSS